MKINGVEYKTIWFDEEKQVVKIIDQTKLPHKFIIKELNSVKDAINAIKTMEVRGAPLIGGTAAFGLVLAIKENNSLDFIKKSSEELVASTPTEINLAKFQDKFNDLKGKKYSKKVINNLVNDLNEFILRNDFTFVNATYKEQIIDDNKIELSRIELYWVNGQKYSETFHVTGLKYKEILWYENGQKKLEGNYINGKYDGIWTQWFANGQKFIEGKYNEDMLIGFWRQWYKNGEIFSSGVYQNSKQVSLTTLFCINISYLCNSRRSSIS